MTIAMVQCIDKSWLPYKINLLCQYLLKKCTVILLRNCWNIWCLIASAATISLLQTIFSDFAFSLLCRINFSTALDESSTSTSMLLLFIESIDGCTRKMLLVVNSNITRLSTSLPASLIEKCLKCSSGLTLRL